MKRNSDALLGISRGKEKNLKIPRVFKKVFFSGTDQ